MGLLSNGQKRQSRRALRRAHTKALKAQAAAERKFAAKNAKKAARKGRKKASDTVAAIGSAASSAASTASSAATTAASSLPAAITSSSPATTDAGKDQAKASKAAAKQQKKVAKQQTKTAKEETKAAEKKQFTPAKAKRYVGIARVIVPVLAPVLYQGAMQVRGKLDERRARAIGVDVENLTDFTGHGAALSARIVGLESSVRGLRTEGAGAAGTEAAARASHDRDFEHASLERLGELSTAVHAAERMPTPRRRAAHTAISKELDGIDGELLRRLGVR